MNDFNFPVDGPAIDGTWQNVQTGDYFTVRDTFIQDNGQLVVQATDGRIFDYNILQNYIKVDKPMNIKPEKKTSQLPKELADEIEGAQTDLLPEDAELIAGGIATSQPLSHDIVVMDDDNKFIHRILDRAKKDPEISVSIKWSKFPDKQMETLVDMLGVDVEKIVDYYINKIQINDLRESLKEELQKYIDKQMSNEDPKEKPVRQTKSRKQ